MSEQTPAYGNSLSDENLRNRFFYHPPKGPKQVKAHEEVSELTFALACRLRDLCPPGRNLAIALTALEDVRMRANAAIACDGFVEE
jgi:hypothetical protein